MRLHKRESTMIFEVLKRFGKEEHSLLIKKRGWVYVQVDGNSFAFHRKTVSNIIGGKLEQEQAYYVRFDSGAAELVHNLQGVADALDTWLKKMRKNE